MSEEDKDTPPQKPNNDPFAELDLPRKNELSVNAVLVYKDRVYKEAVESKKVGGWSFQDVRDLITREINYEEPALRGPVQIVGGETPAIALNHDQIDAVGILFRSDTPDLLTAKHFVSISRAGKKDGGVTKAEVKNVHSLRPETPNHLVISQGLARQLGINQEEGAEVTITDIFQDTGGLNLDKIP